MAALGIGTKLDFINRNEIGTDFLWHRLDRADPILRAIRDNPFFPGDKRHTRGATLRHDPVIDLARQKPQRQANHPGPVAQHAFNRVMRFAGIGRPEDRRYPRRCLHPMFACWSLQFLARCILLQTFHCFPYPLQMGMYSKRRLINLQSLIGFPGFFEDPRESRQRPEMAGVQPQDLRDIGNRRAIEPGLKIGGGAGVPAFGKIGRVIDQRGKMLDRGPGLSDAHRVASALQQKIHRRRPGFGPFAPDLPFQPRGRTLIRLRQL